MANKYWRGGTASWDGTATGKWSSDPSTFVQATLPTSADDVFFDSTSTGTVTIAAGNTGAGSINCTGFAGTITGTAAISVVGSITLNGTMTYSHTGTVTITGTSTLTTASKTFSGITINGASAALTLADPLNISTRLLTVTQGTLNTGGFSITASQLVTSGASAKTINLSSSIIDLSSQVSFGGSSITFNAGTSQINLTGASPGISATGFTFYNVSLTNTAISSFSITGSNTFNNLLITPPAATGILLISVQGNQTINGTLTCAGGSAVRRLFMFSNILGTTRTLTVGTLVADDCDFRDITIAGTASGSSPTRAGDCKGNSGITFPAAKTVYWNLAAGGAWSATAWAASSGASPAVNNFPLAQDTAIVENTGLNTGTTITIDKFWNIGTFDFSNRTTNTVSIATSGGVSLFYYGDYKLGSGVTVNGIANSTFAGRTTQNITSAGKTLPFNIFVDHPNTIFKLIDSTTFSTTITLSAGTIDINSLNLSCANFSSSNSNTRTLAFGSSGVLNLTGTGTVWTTATGALLTTSGSRTVNVTSTGATAISFTSGTITAANAVNINFNGVGSTYTLTLGGTNRDVNFTNFGGSLSNTARSWVGNVTFSAGMTLTAGANLQTFSGTGTQLITTNGKTLDFPITYNGVGGTMILQDAFTMGISRVFTHTNGTLDLNGKTLTVGSSYVTAAGTKNITFDGGILNCPGAGAAAFSNAAPTGFTTSAGTGAGEIQMTSTSAKTFAGGGSNFACTLNHTTASALTITGSNTFKAISSTAGSRTFLFESGSTTNVEDWLATGSAINTVNIASTSSGARHFLNKTTAGNVSVDYMSIVDSEVTPLSTWYAGANSTDVGNNLNWIFTAPPTPGATNGNFLAFF